jgi:dimethylhistidine N-methyltransferase
MRPSAASAEQSAIDRQGFADAVQFYLTQAPRQLPSEYLYDALGSALFEAICHLPWYRITRAERELLRARGAEILARVEPMSTVIELGPGSGDKLATLLGARTRGARTITAHLVDVSATALALAARTVGEIDGVVVSPHRATYEAGALEASAARPHTGRTLMLFLGSNIGNFDPPGADAFLFTLRTALAAGDALLIGADLVKPRRDLLLAYDDPLGVTAAFNRNLLVRLNRELEADFDVDAFAHRAVWSERRSRVEMHLVAKSRQRVRIPPASVDMTLEAGEFIWTESSYKYTRDGIVSMLERAGFAVVEQWLDEEARFALTLVEAL